jgi:hypothetical protein
MAAALARVVEILRGQVAPEAAEAAAMGVPQVIQEQRIKVVLVAEPEPDLMVAMAAAAAGQPPAAAAGRRQSVQMDQV